MANITRIKAKDSSSKDKEEKSKATPVKNKENAKNAPVKAVKKTKSVKASKADKKAIKAEKKLSKKEGKKENKLVKIIKAPGRYIKNSWNELRQVRWPSRGATWKMVLAVFLYTAIIIIFIMLVDALFTLIFNQLLGQE